MLRIAACSYDGSLFGWKVRVDEDEEGGGDGLVAVIPNDAGMACEIGPWYELPGDAATTCVTGKNCHCATSLLMRANVP